MTNWKGSTRWWPVVTLMAVALVAFAPSSHAQDDPVTVEVAVTGDAMPGAMVTATATVTINDGSTVQSYAWTQTGGVDAMLTNTDTDTVSVALGELSAYKDMLFHVLSEPPIAPEDLPPNVPPPEGEFPGGLQNRFEVVGLNPFNLEHTGLVELDVEVVTSSGTYHGTGEIHTTLPWKPTAGIENVPTGVRVVLHGKDQAAYDWAMTVPGGSSAMLIDATMQDPEFTPDVAGMYEVTVTDEATTEAVTIAIYAGTWRGVIVDQDEDNRPVADSACTGCHSGSIAPDAFTPWAQTGHAEIFSNMLDTNTHYGPGCFPCHTVGYDPDAVNGGFDDASDYQAFIDAGLINNPGDNWTTMLADYPEAAQLGNIQCENCHGPQTSDAHTMGEPRGSLSSDLCATCHGEPPRHGRHQQWQLSKHANYELAIDESQSGNCSRCHTGNGFLTWLPILEDDDPETDPTASITVTWTEDEAHPQTCQTCHDPHSPGSTSGDGSNATVRITGDTPPLIAGFTATDVGRGAICMTCHNTRRGLRNDMVWPTYVGTSEAARAPHGGAQADMLMGENAYLVTVGARGSHSMTDNVMDTCVTCHMEATPPPDDISYNQGGSNHTFYARNDICDSCHEGLTGEVIQGPVMTKLANLQQEIEEALYDLMDEQIAAGNTIDLNGDATIADISTVSDIVFGESRGRQAMTVTFADESVVGPTAISSVDVVPPTGDPFGLYDVAAPSLPKAGWNWNLVANDGSYGVHNPTFANAALDASVDALTSPPEPCVEDANTMCLNNNRFKVQVNWETAAGDMGMGNVVPAGSDDSGLFWFFDEANWEMLIKVLDGCSINQNYWVFFAATTDVKFTVTVTDSDTGSVKTYTNPLGQPANAVTDTSAFATCP